ncbi:MAG: chemotaxis protein CheA [Candidatus Omnitrophica bacterium]|nr:chemotaxis protein CheA [Candidatus Omnitrophota bacterium]
MSFDKSKYELQFKSAIQEHLRKINIHLVSLERDPANKEVIAELMREVHSIKGTGALIGSSGIRDIAHALEEGLLAIESAKGLLSREHFSACFECMDAIGILLDSQQRQFTEFSIAELCARVKSTFAQEKDKTQDVPPGQKVSTDFIVGHSIDKYIKIDIDDLQKVFNLAGELMIAKKRLQQISSLCASISLHQETNNKELEKACMQLRDTVNTLDALISSSYAEIMNMRMVRAGELLQLFPRLIRDWALLYGKDVSFKVAGEDTKIDKSILDELRDPLIHLLRNAVDHGIESPDERRKSNKDAQGKITLSASQQGFHIIIEVSDDGRGIDVQALKRKAVAKGIISSRVANEMADTQALQLVFSAGLSTKQEVTDVSGRGVGLDIVRAKVEKLKGIIDVSSTRNAGTSFVIKLPLTLALHDSVFVRVGSERFAVLMDNIIEIRNIQFSEVRVDTDGNWVKINKYIIPLYYLNKLLQIQESSFPDKTTIPVLVVKVVDIMLALAVDEILNYTEIILKPLRCPIMHFPFFPGATITDEGKVCLVLDIPSIVASVKTRI